MPSAGRLSLASADPEPSLTPDAPYRRALVVANPIAGRGQGATVGAEMVEGLRRLGASAELYLTTKRGDARQRLRSLEAGTDLVVSVGGDGTLREVLSGLVDPEIPVGVLPMGTANVLSLDLGLPRDVHRALEIIAARRLERIDVATVNGHLSFLVTGVGIDGLVVRRLEERRRGPIRRLSYLWPALVTLARYREPRLQVELDGEALPGDYGLVLVSNVIHYGGVFRLSPDARRADGRFEVYLLRRGTRRALASFALRALLGRVPSGPVELRRAARIRIASEEPVPYQSDGDYRGTTPVEIEVSSTQYHVLVP